MALRDGPDSLVGSILVLCTHNSVRSPILEAMIKKKFQHKVYVRAAGVESTQISPFAVEVMQEVGFDLANYTTHSYEDMFEDSYDLIIALSRPAYDLAKEIADKQAVDIEYWSCPEPPSIGDGNREQILQSYRRIRDDLKLHLENRFRLALNE